MDVLRHAGSRLKAANLRNLPVGAESGLRVNGGIDWVEMGQGRMSHLKITSRDGPGYARTLFIF